MKTRHLTTSSTLFAGVLATALCVAPPPIEAEVFGYIGVKGGYSYQQTSKISTFSNNKIVSTSSKFFTIQSFPVGGNVGLGIVDGSVGLRLEAEYLYRLKGDAKRVSQTSDDGSSRIDMDLKTRSQSILGNVYLDFYLTPSFSLYVSGGAGVVLLKSELQIQRDDQKGEFKGNDRTLTWQAGVGLGYTFVEHLRLDVNARYVDFGTRDLSTEGAAARVAIRAIEGLVGLAYRF